MGKKQGFSTRAIHSGQPPEKQTGAVMFPIFQTSTYVQESPGKFKNGYDYGRTKNPTRTALEENIANLESGKYGICFASGCASTAAAIHLLKAGDHLLACDDVYGGTFRLFDKVFKQLGIEFSMVDMSDMDLVKKSFRKNTRLVWLETPTNPMLKIFDIAKIAEISKKNKCLLAVDNTFASPCLQNPLLLGADIVSHSSTKYIGGHSDVIGGALIVSSKALAEKLHFLQNALGSVPAPFDCFLLLRSTKTLKLRMEKHCSNAMQIARFLEKHKKVKKVIYPGLATHPQHKTAKKQMSGFGGMVTIELKGGLKESRKFFEKVKIFACAESLGGVESLVEHPAIMTHASIPADQRKALGISDGLVRLSVGIEDIEDLLEDLRQAL